MIRGITLRGATALNVITMIGIGPLITIPLVLAVLPGSLAIAGWTLGALVALCDGLVWAELGSAYPFSGGTYVYLRNVFGAEQWGHLLAFVFNWQFVLSASLIIASGYIGFAQYASYFAPALASNPNALHAVAAAVGVLTMLCVYRRITAVAIGGTVLAAAAALTLLFVGAAGYTHANMGAALAPPKNVGFGIAFAAALGQALFVTLYDYAGYGAAATLGEEVLRPARTLPRAIVLSIGIVFALYLFLQIGVLGGVPWRSLFDAHGAPTAASQYVGSTVVERAWGVPAAAAATALVLLTAFASVYGNLVAASRVPFAAARDGAFLPSFARLHPRGHFPFVGVLGIGVVAIAACFFSLADVIAALTAAAVLGGSIAQIVALFVMRMRGVQAPFRMPLFPLPALLALGGWIFAFISSGARAMLLGTAWLAAGVAVYAMMAYRRRAWPFVAAATLAVCAFAPAPTRAAPFQKPAFVYGAAFFYERMPRSQWDTALRSYRALGINTIDLYVMWNWHELRDGDFDFTGRTNPRRDLRGLFALIRRHGFAIVLRPGPVIRNEWRNGGYPAWLLERSEYRMPLRDILEGRYPATATLQNAHSDAAAQEWLSNATHLQYAARWLQHVYDEARPYAQNIIAVALDDDQGAYLDNDTWPAPHFHEYMEWLARQAHRGMPSVPAFINTYQMKVTASAPVWAWGNWYQSDAYSIGEHDRAQIDFSTGLLATQEPARPIMVSEFQAGWLQGADEAHPRPADPSNTELALYTFLQNGAHGVVNFPVQDTWNPSGWEAPWANAFYAWDAAYSPSLQPQARWTPTAQFGRAIAAYGDRLAKTHVAADAAIAYAASAYDPSALTNADVSAIAAATIAAQEKCRGRQITCELVDLRYDADRLSTYKTLVVPNAGIARPYDPIVERVLGAYRANGGSVVTDVADLHVTSPAAAGIPNATLLVSADERYGFLVVANYDRAPQTIAERYVGDGRFRARVPFSTVPPRSGLLIPLAVASAVPTVAAPPRLPPVSDVAIRASDGFPHELLRTNDAFAAIDPCSGARVFTFVANGRSVFTSIGALRDAWTPQLLPSTRDYIAKYTHPIATGTFNRCYRVVRSSARSATFSYTAPDAPGGNASFEKRVVLTGDTLGVTTRAHFMAGGELPQQITSLVTDGVSALVDEPHGLLIYDAQRRKATIVAWDAAASSSLQRYALHALLTLTYAPESTLHVRYAALHASTQAHAQAAYERFAKRAQP